MSSSDDGSLNIWQTSDGTVRVSMIWLENLVNPNRRTQCAPTVILYATAFGFPNQARIRTASNLSLVLRKRDVNVLM